MRRTVEQKTLRRSPPLPRLHAHAQPCSGSLPASRGNDEAEEGKSMRSTREEVRPEQEGESGSFKVLHAFIGPLERL
jgi:hypothetical protein